MSYPGNTPRPMTHQEYHLLTLEDRLTLLEQKVNGVISSAKLLAWRLAMIGGAAFVATGDITILKEILKLVK